MLRQIAEPHTSQSRLLLHGAELRLGANSHSQRLLTTATARVDGSAGTITYTQLLSPRGTLEADLTITKLPADCAGVGGLGGVSWTVTSPDMRAALARTKPTSV